MQNYEVHYKDFDDAKSNQEYIEWTLARFEQLGRVLKDNGCIAYNLSYSTDEIRMSELMWLVVASIINQGIFTVADTIVWKKHCATPNNVSPNKLTRICEFIFIFCKRTNYDTFYANKRISGIGKSGQTFYENYYNFIDAENNDGPCDIHKATYSTSMCFQVLERYAKPGSLIYDPFMGTGTTAIAAIESKCHFIGSEISAEYCNYANNRINTKLSEPTLF